MDRHCLTLVHRLADALANLVRDAGMATLDPIQRATTARLCPDEYGESHHIARHDPPINLPSKFRHVFPRDCPEELADPLVS